MGLELSGPEIQGLPTNSSAALSKPQSFYLSLLPELLLHKSAVILVCFPAVLTGSLHHRDARKGCYISGNSGVIDHVDTFFFLKRMGLIISSDRQTASRFPLGKCDVLLYNLYVLTLCLSHIRCRHRLFG